MSADEYFTYAAELLKLALARLDADAFHLRDDGFVREVRRLL